MSQTTNEPQVPADLGAIFRQASGVAKDVAKTLPRRPPESLLVLAGSLAGLAIGAAQLAPHGANAPLMVASALVAGFTSHGRHK